MSHVAYQVTHLHSNTILAVIHLVNPDPQSHHLLDRVLQFPPSVSVTTFRCSCNAVRELELHNSGDGHRSVTKR